MIDDGKRQVENVLSSAIAIHSFARSCYVHASCNGDKSMIVKKRRKKKLQRRPVALLLTVGVAAGLHDAT